MNENYYALLGVPSGAGEDEIRRAYRDLVADSMDDQPRFQALSEAFETLKDPARRRAYDGKQTALAVITTPRPKDTGARTGVYAPASGVVAEGTAAAFALPVVCPASLSPCPLKAGQVVPDEGFCPECGVLMASVGKNAPMLKAVPTPYLVDSSGREYPLKAGDNLVGREGADVILPDKSVSRRHAQFDVSKTGAVTVTELGSTNGSRLGSVPLNAGLATALKDGDELRFGAVRVTVRIPEPVAKAIESAAAPVSVSPAIAPKPPAALPSFTGEVAPLPETAPVGVGARLTGTGTNTLTHAIGTAAETTVGRKPENALMITTDPFVSGKHAVILWENDRYKLIDVGSTNGTQWNGRKLLPQVPQTLSDGDEIVFGQTPFVFRV